MPWSVHDWLRGLFHNFEDMFRESLKVIVRKSNSQETEAVNLGCQMQKPT